MITFVTSFFHGKTPKRSYDEYKVYFDTLVESGARFVLFLDRRSLWTFPQNVLVIPLSIEETWVGQNVPEDAVLPQRRSAVDTIEYMKIMNSKTELVFRASQINPFETDWFAWIDFGIAHVFNDATALSRLPTLCPPQKPCTQTAGIWTYIPDDVFDEVCWRYAGGFFLTHRLCAATFHNEVIKSIERNLPRFAWEVNTWADVERNGFDLGWFEASHDDSIIPFTHPENLSTMKIVVDNWTVVTAYFDLTKMKDASPSINARPALHYLDSAKQRWHFPRIWYSFARRIWLIR